MVNAVVPLTGCRADFKGAWLRGMVKEEVLSGKSKKQQAAIKLLHCLTCVKASEVWATCIFVALP